MVPERGAGSKTGIKRAPWADRGVALRRHRPGGAWGCVQGRSIKGLGVHLTWHDQLICRVIGDAIMLPPSVL